MNLSSFINTCILCFSDIIVDTNILLWAQSFSPSCPTRSRYCSAPFRLTSMMNCEILKNSLMPESLIVIRKCCVIEDTMEDHNEMLQRIVDKYNEGYRVFYYKYNSVFVVGSSLQEVFFSQSYDSLVLWPHRSLGKYIQVRVLQLYFASFCECVVSVSNWWDQHDIRLKVKVIEVYKLCIENYIELFSLDRCPCIQFVMSIIHPLLNLFVYKSYHITQSEFTSANIKSTFIKKVQESSNNILLIN